MESKKLYFEKDFIVGIVIIAFGLFMLLNPGKSSSIYTVTVFSMLLLLGVVEIFQAIKSSVANTVEKITVRELVLIVLMLINPFFAKTIGFYLTGFLEILLISVMISTERNGKSLLRIIAFSLIVTIVTYLIFSVGLNIHCPGGILI